VLILR